MNPPGMPSRTGFKERIEALCKDMIDKGLLFSEAMERFESCFIAEVVNRNGGNITRAAAALGIHRNTLSVRLKNRTCAQKR